MSKLLDHIKAKNAEAQAWADAESGRIAGMIVEDLAHWERCNIRTVEQYEHYMIAAGVWDLYKEVTGIRPRWMNMDDMSIAELEGEHDRLLDELIDVQKEEKASQDEMVKEFETLIGTTIEIGAGDRETALRWIRDADDEQMKYDDAYFEYCNGLPYGYLASALTG